MKAIQETGKNYLKEISTGQLPKIHASKTGSAFWRMRSFHPKEATIF